MAQAALYLAGTEKSNSVLGFFDALKTVRNARQQDVPGHLRDANRDGAAFGDGIGYRYPHAYAEHWVEQQYLPAALQGVFWQPGQLGWEGERRERMAERREAQLAAAAGLAADQPLLLSSGPDRPGVDRWVQHQLGQEGNACSACASGSGVTSWTRRDRVLLLGMRSLIWAIDPLRATPEGGVTVLCDNHSDRSRLEAQMDLLEPEHQPALLTGNLDALPLTQAFDWIGGRLASAGPPGAELDGAAGSEQSACSSHNGLATAGQSRRTGSRRCSPAERSFGRALQRSCRSRTPLA